jgi:hypothetical protein
VSSETAPATICDGPAAAIVLALSLQAITSQVSTPPSTRAAADDTIDSSALETRSDLARHVCGTGRDDEAFARQFLMNTFRDLGFEYNDDLKVNTLLLSVVRHD